MRARALACTVLAILVLIASGCTPGRHGPSPVTLTAVVNPPSGAKKGTVTILFKPSGDWSVNGVDHPPTFKIRAPKGLVFSPVYPVLDGTSGNTDPGTYKAYPDPQDTNKVELYYEVVDKRSVPADVTLSIRYERYSDRSGSGYADEDLVVRIPK